MDHCGSCTRCIQACPTQCILSDRTIDARRCISYLTIELKADIPEELRPQMGEWVFGCDVCQQVCPWNIRFAPAAGDPAFAPRPGTAKPILIDELALTPEAFNQKFKGSPVKRCQMVRLPEECCRCAGELGDIDALPALQRLACRIPEPLVRRHAAWAVEEAGGERMNLYLPLGLKFS